MTKKKHSRTADCVNIDGKKLTTEKCKLPLLSVLRKLRPLERSHIISKLDPK